MEQLRFFDSHCHLNFKAFGDDLWRVVLRARKNGVVGVIVPGADVVSSRQAVAICRKINRRLGIGWALGAVGIHPIHAQNGGDFSQIISLARSEEVAAIGECGVDRFRQPDKSALGEQVKLFQKHVELSLAAQKPLIVHNRLGDEEVLACLKKFPKLPSKIVFHCFSSDWKFAQKVLALGAYISFAGNITYGNKDLKKVVERAPLERIMVETDAPFIVPEPDKSEGAKRNEPFLVARVVGKIAEIREEEPSRAASQVLENTKGFFGIGMCSKLKV